MLSNIESQRETWGTVRDRKAQRELWEHRESRGGCAAIERAERAQADVFMLEFS